MGLKLCTAEKPSVAAAIANVLGANQRKNGYYEGNGYLVTWAVGHLVGLAEPDAYGFTSQQDMWNPEEPEKKVQAMHELPLIPSKFKPLCYQELRSNFRLSKTLCTGRMSMSLLTVVIVVRRAIFYNGLSGNKLGAGNRSFVF